MQTALTRKASITGINSGRIRGFIAPIETWGLNIQTSARLREPVSGLTHCIGAILSMIGLVLLVWTALHPFRPWHLATYVIYGTSMISLYIVSMLFHWLPLSEERILHLRKLDHIMIFVFIAATYTPAHRISRNLSYLRHTRELRPLLGDIPICN